MLDFTKAGYTPMIEGVVNSETRWIITRDSEMVEVIEDSGFSSDHIDRYFSNIAIPVDKGVFVWYQMKMSDGEVKDIIGPVEYVSREANVTSDLKPTQYVTRPTIEISPDTPLESGANIIKFTSSMFKGDPLDGHLKSTWALRTPDGVIRDVSLNTSEGKYEYQINRSKHNLNNHEYVEIILQHHSADGATSEFNSAFYSMSSYPFKFIGMTVADPRLPYTFNISPYDINNPNISKVDVVDGSTLDVLMSYSDMSSLTFTIPAYTLPSNRDIRIYSYVDDVNVGNGYPVRLESVVSTRRVLNTYQIDSAVEYNTEIINNRTTIGGGVVGASRMVSDRAVFMNDDGTGMILVKHGVPAVDYEYANLTVTQEVLDLIGIEWKLINMQSGNLLLITRSFSEIKLIQLELIDLDVVLADGSAIHTLVVEDTPHNLNNTVSISEDEKSLYSVIIKDTDVLMVKVDISLGTVEEFNMRDDIILGNYHPEFMLLMVIDDKSIISMGGVYDSELLYQFNITTEEWLAVSQLPDGMLSPASSPTDWFVPDCIKLQNRSLLFTNNDSTDLSGLIFTYGTDRTIKSSVAGVYLDAYTLFMVESNGVLVAVNTADGKQFSLVPTRGV